MSSAAENDDDDEREPASFSRSDGTDLNDIDAEDKQQMLGKLINRHCERNRKYSSLHTNQKKSSPPRMVPQR